MTGARPLPSGNRDRARMGRWRASDVTGIRGIPKPKLGYTYRSCCASRSKRAWLLGAEYAGAGSIATQRAISDATGLAADLRWPNDVLIEESGVAKKCAGILAQLEGRAVVAGIGINVNHIVFPTDIEATATSLRLAGKRDVPRERSCWWCCSQEVDEVLEDSDVGRRAGDSSPPLQLCAIARSRELSARSSKTTLRRGRRVARRSRGEWNVSTILEGGDLRFDRPNCRISAL